MSHVPIDQSTSNPSNTLHSEADKHTPAETRSCPAMTIPRRANDAVTSDQVPDPSNYVLVLNRLDLPNKRTVANSTFMALEDMLGTLKIQDEDPKATKMMCEVTSHALFASAVAEYKQLHATFLPGFNMHSEVPTKTMHSDGKGHHKAELEEGLKIFIDLTRRRRERAEQFYRTLQTFLAEYEAAVSELQGLSDASPLLKGTHLSQKIEDLKETVKRKYGSKVQELQRECVNKRRRTNLPDSAVEIFREWFRTHKSNPYPTEDEKTELAERAGVSEAQVSNWFVNVRKRYWKPHATDNASTVSAKRTRG